MAKGVDFSAILDKSVDDIESPKPLPSGAYRGIISAPPSQDDFERTNDDGSKTTVGMLIVSVAIQEPMQGVDEDLLKAAGGLRRKDGKPKEVQMRYYLEEDSLHKIKKLLKSCGITTGSLREGIEQLAGCEVIADLGVQQGRNDPEEFYQRVNKIAGTAA